MTRRRSFNSTARPNARNLKSFAARLHLECDQMIGRIYNAERERQGLPLADASDLRVMMDNRLVVFLLRLYEAQQAMLEAQQVLERE